jgi:tRNA threonylcarbamoyladenosine modification (KEOPS) complex  Pcc1 subunit
MFLFITLGTLSFHGITMAKDAKATVRLKFSSKKQLATLLEALTPEANTQVTRRANVKLEKNGLTLLLTVDAEDTVALRATLNAYLRWINSTINIMDIIEKT